MKMSRRENGMSQSLRVGMIADFAPDCPSYVATNNALDHAAKPLDVTVEPTWLPTRSLDNELSELRKLDALCAPGGMYDNTDGALRAIRFAREEGWPFIGT
jgi:CTP synthase (UTP-ammonia lyase)